jgi:hypothetical protein
MLSAPEERLGVAVCRAAVSGRAEQPRQRPEDDRVVVDDVDYRRLLHRDLMVAGA